MASGSGPPNRPSRCAEGTPPLVSAWWQGRSPPRGVSAPWTVPAREQPVLFGDGGKMDPLGAQVRGLCSAHQPGDSGADRFRRADRQPLRCPEAVVELVTVGDVAWLHRVGA